MPHLNLVVLRFPDIEQAVDFYAIFGLSFSKHAHGKGSEHYATESGAIVLELYPQASEEASTRHVRIGFSVPDAATIIASAERKGGKIVSALKDSEWGRRAVFDDPFGHRIEITEEKK